jgi:hypothetical protein
MSEDLPGHLVQALVQTGNMASEKEMNNTIRRIGRDNIFPKAPFAADSDFIDVNGKIYKTCAKAYKNGGGNKEHFKQHWKNGGWKTARAALNSKRNSTQDSVCKHLKKCKRSASLIDWQLMA